MREERLTRNVKIIIRGIYQVAWRARYVKGLDFLRGGAGRDGSRYFKLTCARTRARYTERQRFLQKPVRHRILPRTYDECTSGFIGFYSLFGTDAYCCTLFARRINQTREKNDGLGDRGNVSLRVTEKGN